VTSIRPGLATLAAAALPAVGVAVLAVYGNDVAHWIDATPTWQVALAVMAVGVAACGTALLPTHALSLAAGYALGIWAGPAVAWVTVLVASLLGYTTGRLAAGGRFARSIRDHPRLGTLADALLDASLFRTAWLLALLRLSPLAPFAATNVALAAIRTPWLPYVAGSAVGLAPRVIVVALFGAGLAELDWQNPRSHWLLVLGGVATVAALLIVGHVASRALRRQQAGTDA
jgi:uncharacterized membrane protein YdjX (TVP38/TMEM64 family)